MDLLILSEDVEYGEIINKNDSRIVGVMDVFDDNVSYFTSSHFIFTFVEEDSGYKVLCKL